MAEKIHLYSVGEVAQMTGVSRKTLFRYDQAHLLIPVERKGIQKFKMYDDASLQRLKMIQRYQKAGLKLDEVKMILDDPECDRELLLRKVLGRLEKDKSSTDQKIRNLRILIQEYC